MSTTVKPEATGLPGAPLPAAAAPVAAEPTLSRDLVSLTKPRIISLLLVTTIAPMYAAGSPTLLAVLLVTIGGYLMAGGANAVNMYIDRDIDDVMARTRLRPIPSGRMSPIQVLAFGVACATFATWMLARYVNVLTAGRGLAALAKEEWQREEMCREEIGEDAVRELHMLRAAAERSVAAEREAGAGHGSSGNLCRESTQQHDDERERSRADCTTDGLG